MILLSIILANFSSYLSRHAFHFVSQVRNSFCDKVERCVQLDVHIRRQIRFCTVKNGLAVL